MNWLKPLSIIAILLGAVMYLGGILWAGFASIKIPTPPQLPEVVTFVVKVIGGVLATNFGALFGITVLQNGGQITKGLTMDPRSISKFSRTKADWFQIIAAYVYFFSLLIALVFWFIDKFSAQSADMLKDMTFTLIGVIVGMLSVALNLKSDR